MPTQHIPLITALVLAFMVNVLAGRVAIAQNEAATETPSTAADTTIRLLSEMMKDGADGKNSVVKKEIVLDLETGNVALQVVSWKHTKDGQEIVAVVPFMENLEPEQASKLARGLSEEKPPSMNRQLAATVYKEFGRDVYWSKYLERLPADAHGKFDRERFELTGFTELKGKRVVDAEGVSIGNLADIGVDEASGAIVYCVVQSEDKSQRAIPLGAFVDRDAKKDWKIELQREQVMMFEPFGVGTTPQQIDRGWQEYVAVRYGRNALQTEAKGEINREKVQEQKSERDK